MPYIRGGVREEGAEDRDSFMRTGLTCMSTRSLFLSRPRTGFVRPPLLGEEHGQGVCDEEAPGRRNDAAAHHAHKPRLAQLPDRRPGAVGQVLKAYAPFRP